MCEQNELYVGQPKPFPQIVFFPPFAEKGKKHV